MRPIPKKLLIHSAELLDVRKDDMWQSTECKKAADLKNIRIEPSSQLVTDKQNRQINLAAVMFFDCTNSTPHGTLFKHGQKIRFCGSDYTVETIEPLYDGSRLHHYELGLIL